MDDDDDGVKEADSGEDTKHGDPTSRAGPLQVAGTITRLLHDWQGGDAAALDKLTPLIYAELRKIAASYMNRERPGHTLRPTDLVQELYVRLIEYGPPSANDKRHFFAIAARIMRQILVDSARYRCATKRGSGERPVTFDERIAAVDRPELLVELDDALAELAKVDERAARVIELYYYGGLTQDEVALVLEVHVNTIARDLRFGLAWVQTYLDARGA